MKIKTLSLYPYETQLITGKNRHGALLSITDDFGHLGWGDIAPLPKWSLETLNDAIEQFKQKQKTLTEINWQKKTILEQITHLDLLPSVSFALESALLSMLDPLPSHRVPVSALLMGSPEEILANAKIRQEEGYSSAKLKVGHLKFTEASRLIHQLKDTFSLRIDVNRAWTTKEALHFFSEFPLDTFDYVEEPFQNPHELALFPHPLAIDESFPKDLSLAELELLPTLKALIYKPTLQGGLANCLHLQEWTQRKNIQLVLSSSFESDLGLAHIVSMAHRLTLSSPIGIGTYHFLKNHTFTDFFKILNATAYVTPV